MVMAVSKAFSGGSDIDDVDRIGPLAGNGGVQACNHSKPLEAIWLWL
jgi:hypothetical protein